MYYYCPCYCCYSSHLHQPLIRQEPHPVFLQRSAENMQQLLSEADVVSKRLSESYDDAAQLMQAAQDSKKDEVLEIIRSFGVTEECDVFYTPDGIQVEFMSYIDDVHCCKLTMLLRWM
ncbi:hypothetical protein SAMN05192534_101316 [Alteribacillus persepolensis]|uniref:Uncharacterized protein n=1 Tax=Alteribacillus persepolensis TaxID=568899 RepID=A0A1G7YXH8_9BACI|nr:hypothetical protein [Alteribacillus persepolensis]SDH01262.1 hypothetical protein SAMN05192534_101316 [Alteribacillus persepolensis]